MNKKFNNSLLILTFSMVLSTNSAIAADAAAWGKLLEIFATEYGKSVDAEYAEQQRLEKEKALEAQKLESQRQAQERQRLEAARLENERKQKEAQALRQAEENKKAEAERIASDKAFEQSLKGLSAGQLYAKADEMSAQGDKSKSRVALRNLVARFPDHPLAATAAKQITTMNASASPSNTLSPSTNGNVSSTKQSTSSSSSSGDCDALLAKQEREFEAVNQRPLPAGASPGLQRVMWMTGESIKLIKTNCPDNSKYTKYLEELQTSYNQAETACGQIMAGGVCPGPNAY